MTKPKYYSVHFIVTISSTFLLVGCKAIYTPAPGLKVPVEDNFLEESTSEEAQLYSIIFAGDKAVSGSIAWLRGKIDENIYIDSWITSEELWILFEYPLKEFPSDYEEGIITCGVSYLLQPDYVGNSWFEGNDDSVEYPTRTSIARLPKDSNKQKRAQVHYITWFSRTTKTSEKEKLNRIQKAHKINEEFELQNSVWKLIKFDSQLYEVVPRKKSDTHHNPNTNW